MIEVKSEKYRNDHHCDECGKKDIKHTIETSRVIVDFCEECFKELYRKMGETNDSTNN